MTGVKEGPIEISLKKDAADFNNVYLEVTTLGGVKARKQLSLTIKAKKCSDFVTADADKTKVVPFKDGQQITVYTELSVPMNIKTSDSATCPID